jgi:hypothetical protein
LVGDDRAVDEISDERGMVTPDIDGMGDTGDGFAGTRGVEQILGFDREFDQRVETGIGGEVEDGLGLRFVRTSAVL